MKDYDRKTYSKRVNANILKGSELEVPGDLYKAATNKGHLVEVWVPDSKVAQENRYFCHGWSLGTYEEFGYTVMSGEDAAQVLVDEYTQVTPSGKGKHRFANSLPSGEADDLNTCLQAVNKGSVAAWEDDKGLILHSARIEDFVFEDVKSRTAAQTLLTTKNGVLLAVKVSALTEVCATYKHLTHFRLWNKGAPPDSKCVIL